MIRRWTSGNWHSFVPDSVKRLAVQVPRLFSDFAEPGSAKLLRYRLIPSYCTSQSSKLFASVRHIIFCTAPRSDADGSLLFDLGFLLGLHPSGRDCSFLFLSSVSNHLEKSGELTGAVLSPKKGFKPRVVT